MKKILLTGLTAAMLAESFLPTEGNAASETTEVTEAAASKTLTNQFVVEAAAQWMQMDSYIQRGGDYQEGEYQTFKYNDIKPIAIYPKISIQQRNSCGI